MNKPFKVLCINSTPNDDEFDGPMPEEGQEYTALEEVNGINTRGQRVPCYVIAELQTPLNHVYDQKRFIRLSEIDETINVKLLCPAAV